MKFKKPTSKSPFMPPSSPSKEDGHGFAVNFSQFDLSQGASIEDIQKIKKLAHTLDIFRTFGSRNVPDLLANQGRDKFCVYGDFPDKKKTDFKHPKHVPEDAQWARIHVNGKFCIIGHVVRNIFYLVFFDTEHKFYKSELKNT